jgi:hypothetical protein
MNKFIKTSFWAITLMTALVTISSSCKKKFDEPPVFNPASLTANTSIRDLKAKFNLASNKASLITADIVIKGIVIADDKSGNFFKQLVIQDGTAGILLNLGGTSLYTTYPIGREVFIKCQGLYIGNYSGVLQLGAGESVTSSGFPTSLDLAPAEFDTYIIKGELGKTVTPVEVTVNQLTTGLQDTLQYTLIKLNNFEFKSGDTSKTYAIASTKTSVNYTIANCAGGSITLRNSGFANFADISVPNGNGSVVAVYTLFGNTKQVFIRDTADLKFNGTRCGSGGGGGGAGTGNLLNEDFESQTVPTRAPYNAVAISGWNNLSELGTKKFDARSFGTPINKYAQISAFVSTTTPAPPTTSWLVTKAIDLGTFATKTLNFDTKQGFIGTGGVNVATLKVLVSTNYTGTGNPWASGVTWADITASAALSAGTATNYPSASTPSGDINLNYTGTIYIAFKYEGEGAKTSTWQIDNIKVSGN